MALIVSDEEARAHRFHYVNPGGDTGWVNHYLGQLRRESGKNPALEAARQSDTPLQVSDEIYPVALQVQQDPGKVLGVHFHQADQFQVVLPGDGKFGRAPIPRPIVHFAAACSAYGPITSGEQVLKYFTLRNGWEPGALHFPEHRPESFRRGRKPRSVHAFAPNPSGHPAQSPEIESLIPPDKTGLFATHFRIPADAELATPEPKSGRGQYWVVLSGTCVVEGRSLGEHSLWFVRPEESPMAVRAGPAGASLIAMQFPRFDLNGATS